MEILRRLSAGGDTNNAAPEICIAYDTLATYLAARVCCHPQACPQAISLRNTSQYKKTYQKNGFNSKSKGSKDKITLEFLI
jgi:hypothetical protein